VSFQTFLGLPFAIGILSASLSLANPDAIPNSAEENLSVAAEDTSATRPAPVNRPRSPDVIELGSTTIKGKVRAPADSRTRAEAVTIVNAEELRGSSNSLEDVLSKVAGVKVRQTGGLGSASRMSIHGLEGKRVKILVNGSPIDAPDGNFAINDIPIDFIERIEIYKGYVPARFGGDGMGGAVNIVTRDFEENYVDGSYSIATHNTHRATWLVKRNFDGIGRPGGRLEIGTGGFYNHSDNDYDFRSPYIDSLVIRREHDAYTSLVLATAVKARHYWFDEVELEVVRYSNAKEIQGISHDIREARTESRTWLGALHLEKENFIPRIDIEMGATLLHLKGRVIDTSHVRYIGWDGDYTESPGPRGEVNDRPSLATTVHQEYKQFLHVDWRLGHGQSLGWNSRLRLSEHERKDSIGSEAAGYNVAGNPGRLRSLISGLTLESDIRDGLFVNLLGAKFYNIRSEASSTVNSLQGDSPTRVNSVTSLGWDESFRFQPRPWMYIKAGYQNSMRLPVYDEIFGNGIAIASNPNLTPERAHNFFTGTMFDLISIPLIKRLQFELNGFHMIVEDMIKLQSVGTMGAAYYNLESVGITGFDTELKWDATRNLYLWGNYTFQDARNRTFIQSVGIEKGYVVPNIPRRFANIGAELRTDGLFAPHDEAKLFWSGSWTDAYDYNWRVSIHQNRSIPESWVQDAGMEYTLFRRALSWSLEVRNLGDRQVYDEYNLPKPGRTLATKLRFTFIN
jgi:vitamin B12 transporter